VAALLLVLATAWAYSGVGSHDFVHYDDDHYVTANPHVRAGLSWASMRWAFTSVGHADNWHPLTWLSHMLDVQLFGLAPRGHHLTNFSLHVVATLLLLGFLSHATRRPGPSALVAAGFALHPLHVESVAWIAERKDVLSASFGFAALWAYSHHARAPSRKRYLLVFLLFALGLLAKPMLVTLPLLLLLLDVWPLERLSPDLASFRRRLVEKLPLLALALASSVVTVIAQRQALGSLERYGLGIRLANAVVAYGVYLRQALWPTDLSVLYSYSRPRSGSIVAALALLVAISLVVRWLGRRHKFLITGWLWYLVSLLPVIGLVQVGSQPHADRYTYIPLVGVLVAVVWGAAAVLAGASRRLRYLAYTACAVIVLAMTLQTRAQLGYWKNGVTLFTHAFAVTQGRLSEIAYYNFGNILLAASRRDEAASHFEQALKINPHHAASHVSYGVILSDRGQTEAAIRHYWLALARDPSIAEAHNNLGTALAKSGRQQEAAAHFSKALELDPGNGDAHYNLAFLLSGLDRMDEAIVHYRRALATRPEDGGARLGLALCLARVGRLREATAEYGQVLEREPLNLDALTQLAQTLALTRQWDAATSLAERALAVVRATGDPAQVAAVQGLLRSLDEARASSPARGLE
jgi:protein O-mannosyl-transferase